MENLSSSTDRLAWQPTREQGRGSGFTVHNDKQPAASSNRPLIRDYYKSKKYADMLRVE
ncbi:hypothetical protein LCGC14_0814910 [marine sediment metagenome]|uniref:Uncharacterized protein n=1 Tax=marine sediment metagenome TaxID=412755 RepID=A0A0F9Q5X6_9ZZZZ